MNHFFSSDKNHHHPSPLIFFCCFFLFQVGIFLGCCLFSLISGVFETTSFMIGSFLLSLFFSAIIYAGFSHQLSSKRKKFPKNQKLKIIRGQSHSFSQKYSKVSLKYIRGGKKPLSFNFKNK